MYPVLTYLTFILHLDGVRPSISSYLFFYDIAYLSMSLKLPSVFKFKQKKLTKTLPTEQVCEQLVLEGLRVSSKD